MRTLRMLTPLTLLIATLGGCGNGEQKPTPPLEDPTSLDSPQATFQAFREAAERNDWAGAAPLLDAESQAMIAFGMLMHASFSTGAEAEKEESLNALFKKHGIDLDENESPTDADPTDPTAMMQAVVAPIEDIPEFLGELSSWMENNAPASDDSDGFMEMGELSQVAIDGDTATATVTTPMGEMPIQFQRVKESWLVQLPMDGPDRSQLNEVAEPGTVDPNAPELGTMWIQNNSFTLRHVIAYSSKFFDDPCTVVLLTTRPIPERERNKLTQMLSEQGNDDAFHVWVPQIKLTFDEAGELMFANAWAENHSASQSGGAVGKIEQEGTSVKGEVSLKTNEPADDSAFRFDVTFNTELISSEAK